MRCGQPTAAAHLSRCSTTRPLVAGAMPFLFPPPHTCSSRPDPVPQQLLEAAMCDLRTRSPAPDIALQPRASQPAGQAGVSPRPPRQRVQGTAVHVHMHARHVRGHTLWEACRCFHSATTCGLTAGPHDRASLLGARSHWRCAVHPLMFPAAHITPLLMHCSQRYHLSTPGRIAPSHNHPQSAPHAAALLESQHAPLHVYQRFRIT